MGSFRPLPPEIFMRGYYEPRLLTRLMNSDSGTPARGTTAHAQSARSCRIRAGVGRGASRPCLLAFALATIRCSPIAS